MFVKKTFLTYLISCIPALLLANAGVKLYVNNNCPEPITFSDSGNDVLTVEPYKSKYLGYATTKNPSFFHPVVTLDNYSLTAFNAENNEKSTINIALKQNALRLFKPQNSLSITPTQDKSLALNVDNLTKSWFSWFGTPKITVTTCQDHYSIKSSEIFNGVSRVLIFGDILSDKGTLNEYTKGIMPSYQHYYNGMFSNGDSWSWILKNDLSWQGVKVSNYAVGGATTVFMPDLKHLPYSFDGEMAAFNLNSLKGWQDSYGSFLAIIWIGANDYLSDKDSSDYHVDKATSAVRDNIKKNTLNLLSKGVHKFVFINLPNLGKTPDLRQDASQSEAARKLTKKHNKKLRIMVEF